MRRSRAFVQHSVITTHNDREGTPLAVLEAMATALPVIATRHAGIADVVEHERSGLLVEERDIEAMAAHMLAMARDPERAKALGLTAREKILRDHRIEDRLGALRTILLKAIER
jgi:glycosyltransferase involved in cell wall biosynthesis